jgi:hypothetical protein
MSRSANNSSTFVIGKCQMNYVAYMFPQLANKISPSDSLHTIGMKFEECFDPPLSYKSQDYTSYPSEKYTRLVRARFLASNTTIKEMRQVYKAMPDLRNLPIWLLINTKGEKLYKSQVIYTNGNKQIRASLNLLRLESENCEINNSCYQWVRRIAAVNNDESLICLCFRLREAKENDENDLYEYIEKLISRIFISGFLNHFYLYFSIDDFLSEFANNYLIKGKSNYWPLSKKTLLEQVQYYQEIRILSYQLDILSGISEGTLINRTLNYSLKSVVEKLRSIKNEASSESAINIFNKYYPEI